MGAEAKLIIKAVDQVSSVFSGIKSAGSSMSSGLSTGFSIIGGIGTKLMEIGAAATVGFGVVMKVAGDAEAALRDTMTMTGQVGTQFDKTFGELDKYSMNLAEKFGKSGTEINSAFYAVLSSGNEVGKEGFNKLTEAALTLSQVTKIDLAQGVEQLSDTLNIFGKDASEAEKVASQFFRASQLGATTVPQLMEAMKQAAPTARLMGMSLEETTAWLTLFASKSTKGATAGYAFKTMMSRLTSDSKDVKEALAAMGVEVFKGGEKMRSTGDVFKDFGKIIRAMPKEEAAKIFQKLGVSAYESEQKIGSIKDMMWEFEKITQTIGGKAEAEKLFKSLGIATLDSKGKVKEFNKMFQEFRSLIGRMPKEEAAAIFQQMGIEASTSKSKVKDIKDLLFELESKFKSGTLSAAAKKVFEDMGVSIATSAGKMRPTLDIFKDMQQGLKKLSDEERIHALKALAGDEALATMANVMLTNLDIIPKFNKEINNASVELKNAKEQTDKGLNETLKRTWQAFQNILKVTGEVVTKGFTPFVASLETVTKGIREWLSKNKEVLEIEWNNIISYFSERFQELLNVVQPYGEKILEEMNMQTLLEYWEALQPALSEAWDGILSTLGEFLAWIDENKPTREQIINFLKIDLPAGIKAARQTIEELKIAGQVLMDFINNWVKPFIQAIGMAVADLGTWLGTAYFKLEEFWGKVNNWFLNLFTKFFEFQAKMENAGTNIIEGFSKAIKKAWLNFLNQWNNDFGAWQASIGIVANSKIDIPGLTGNSSSSNSQTQSLSSKLSTFSNKSASPSINLHLTVQGNMINDDSSMRNFAKVLQKFTTEINSRVIG